MAELVPIVGSTGSGKTRSVINLPPEETFIASTVGRSLTFPGWKKKFSAEKKNFVKAPTYAKMIKALQYANSNEKIKYILIDDADYLMNKEMFKRSSEKGYDKYTEIAKHMYELLEYIDTQLRDDLIVFVVFHEEKVLVDGFKPMREIRTPGKMIKEKFHPFELSNIVLFTEVEYDSSGKPSYYFRTQRSDMCERAKSPEGMFDSALIPNDLTLVVKAIKSYENN